MSEKRDHYVGETTLYVTTHPVDRSVPLANRPPIVSKEKVRYSDQGRGHRKPVTVRKLSSSELEKLWRDHKGGILMVLLVASMAPIWRQGSVRGLNLFEFIKASNKPEADWRAAHIPYSEAVDGAQDAWRSL